MSSDLRFVTRKLKTQSLQEDEKEEGGDETEKKEEEDKKNEPGRTEKEQLQHEVIVYIEIIIKKPGKQSTA